MYRLLVLSFVLSIATPATVLAAEAPAESDAVKAQLANPPREYASAPLWVWNDLLTEDQVRSTLRDLAGQKVKQAFVHPRPGLMTPYLSDDWFRLWRVALDEAEKLDMNIWVYDENSYPSGFAGGLVPEAMPESRGRGLVFAETKNPGKPGENVHLVYRLADGRYENVTQQAQAGQKLPDGRYLVGTWVLAPEGGWFGGKFYVDLLKPGVTEKFIEITFEAYKKQIGEQFGRRMPGIFTDEPHLCPAGGLHWNEHLAEEFQKRWGYRMEDHFVALLQPLGDWKKVRHDYQQVLLEQFVEHWGKLCHDWCEKNKLEFTGHYWEHGWPGAGHGPDNMAMYAWHQRPAIDCLMNQYSEDVHSQFGNVRAVKELASVANQLGRRRTLCETYGAGGWDLRFEDMKRIGDWIYVLGVNTNDEHLSYVTLRGARKADHPQSFSYHEPWWSSYHVMADYFTRLSLALSSGKQVNHILVLEPTTTAWMYQPDGKKLKEIGDSFQKLVTDLEKAQVEFDVGSEDIIARHGSVPRGDVLGQKGDIIGKHASLKIAQRGYSLVVLPPHTENVNGTTMRLLEEFVGHSGMVLCCGDPPSLVDGRPSDRGQKLAAQSAWRQLDPATLPEAIPHYTDSSFRVRRAAGDPGILFHHRRRLKDGDVLFLVNTSIEAPSTGIVESLAKGAERWDAATGKVSAMPFEKTPTGIRIPFAIPRCGSLLLFLSKSVVEPVPAAAAESKTILPAGPAEVRRIEPNVLTIDYVDITAGGETRKGLHFYQANQMAFQRNGMERNPWDSAVQLHDQLITRKFPPESGFEATYRFTIEEKIPAGLEIVIERPDLYAIACNGRPVKAKPGAWWLDKAFGRIDLADVARVGENSVTIKAQPFTIFHELEPAYVLGDFTLKPAAAGLAIVPPQPLKLDKQGWNEQGCPFYSAGVAYTEKFQVGQPSRRYVVGLPAWYGSVARVSVNGRPAGHVAWQPWECDVTELVKPGENTVEVLVIGTLKNTLGPHHAGKLRGSAWPSAFRQGPQHGPPPGEAYDTIGYGLFEPFVLKQR
jgi:hypothetical protein